MGKLGERLYPSGSTAADRDDVIKVLGALKVATATQIMRLVRPHLSDNKTIRNALLDQERHNLVVSEGNTAGPRGRIGSPGRSGPAAQKLWRLTPAGLDYADQVLLEGVDGGVARGVARGGAKHAMAVNETVTTFVRGGTEPGAARGICGVEAFRTEVHLPLASGSKAAVRVDAVLRAPVAGVPVMMIEVDRHTESPQRVAEKLARYAQYFARPVYEGRRTLISASETKLHWQTLYPSTGRPSTPPVAMVFAGAGRKALSARINAVMRLTREHWEDSFTGTSGRAADRRRLRGCPGSRVRRAGLVPRRRWHAAARPAPGTRLHRLTRSAHRTLFRCPAESG